MFGTIKLCPALISAIPNKKPADDVPNGNIVVCRPGVPERDLFPSYLFNC
jgi:hypothetical protein